MTTPSERLSAAIHLECAAIAPQTSELIEAAKEMLAENERLLAALEAIKQCDDCDGSLRVMMALNQQLSVNSEEGK